MNEGVCHSPKVSFIIPMYNVENYLSQCLESVLAQSIDKEIILINDGSTDDSLTIALKFAEQHPEIKVIHYHKNHGQSHARNQGLAVARGDYIYCVDADDYLLGDHLVGILELNQTYQVDLIRMKCRLVLHDSYHNPVAITYPKPHIANYQPDVIYQMSGEVVLNSMLHHDLWSPGICWTLIRREFLQRHQLQFLEGVKAEDQLFYVQLLTCQPDIKVLEFPNCVYSYQLRFGTTITTESVQYILDHFTIIDKIKAWNTEHQFSEQTKNSLLMICQLLFDTALKSYNQMSNEYKKSIAHLFENE